MSQGIIFIIASRKKTTVVTAIPLAVTLVTVELFAVTIVYPPYFLAGFLGEAGAS